MPGYDKLGDLSGQINQPGPMNLFGASPENIGANFDNDSHSLCQEDRSVPEPGARHRE
jgi:hypothetical protein